MKNALQSNQRRGNCIHKTFKIEIKKGGSKNSDFLQEWFPKKITSPDLNL